MIAEKLRKAILQAAMQGKLTQQLPEDGDARDLLAEIQQEKQRKIKAGELKATKPLPPIDPQEVPYEIPENWVWTRLGEVTNYGMSKQISKSSIPHGSWVLELEDIEKSTGKLISLRTNCLPGSSKLAFAVGDVLYGKLRPYLRKIIVAHQPGFCTSEIIPFRGYASLQSLFLKFFMLSPYTTFTINSNTFGTKMPRAGTSQVRVVLLPLPPLPEQGRIVFQIQNVFPLIDELEKVEKELGALEQEFPEKLKKSLLQAAMQGKLTEQLPEDGDARHLLAEIQQERQRKIKTGEIKATKPLPPINPEEAPYEIPPNWVWTRLGNVVTDNRQKAPETEFTYIDIGSINNKLMKLGSLNNVLKPNDAPTRARKIVKFGDVIYSTVRPYLHNASVIDVEIKPPPIASTGFFVASPIWNTSASYVLYWLVSPISDNIINDVSNSRGVAYPAISESSLKRIPIPLPPFSEQKRLVARLDALLPLCEGLKPT